LASGITRWHQPGMFSRTTAAWPAGLTAVASDASRPGVPASERWRARAGRGGAYLAAGVGLLRPKEQALAARLNGWASQQMARRLSPGTAAARPRAVAAFAAHAATFPWSWTAQLADEWFTHLRRCGAAGLDAAQLPGGSPAVLRVRDRARPTAGRGSAWRGSGRIRCRCATSGTPRCTSGTPEVAATCSS
jgi:hypothetical protein